MGGGAIRGSYVLTGLKIKVGLTVLLYMKLFIYVLGAIESVHGLGGGEGTSLRKCEDFQDKRSGIGGAKGGGSYSNSLTIPANLSSLGEALHFKLKQANLVPCDGETFAMNIKYKNGLTLSPSEINAASWARNFQDVSEARKPLPIHFTKDGHFYHGQYFLHPETDYCINSISNSGLELLACQQTCDEKTKTSTSIWRGGREQPKRICFPKCCAIDEALQFWRRQCVKLNETEAKSTREDLYWKPKLYEEGSRRRRVDSQNNVKFFLADIPSDCNYVKVETKSGGDERSGEDYDDGPYVAFYSSAYMDHPHPGEEPALKDNVRLAVDKNGNVKPELLYSVSRKWVVEETVQFCADAFISKGDSGAGSGQINSDNFLVFYCSPPEQAGQIEMDHAKGVYRSTVYTSTSLTAWPFLVATVAIYFILFDKLNLHGLTILSFSTAECLSFTLLISAHLIFLFEPNEFIRSWNCYLIAITAYFFFLSSYLWLTVMNFDLWMTFKNLRVVRGDVKEWKKFTLYSLVAWGVPFVVTVAFVVIDKVYRDPVTEVPVPDFGISSCFVSPYFRGYYVHAPVAIIMSLNIALILLTMKIFFDARKQNKVTLGESSSNVNAKKYSAKLFAKLFIVMGGTSLIDFLSWYYTKTEADKPWTVVILESITYLVPIYLFVIFCLNDKTRGQLSDRFPWCTTGWSKIFRRSEDESTATTGTTGSSADNPKEKFRLKASSAKGNVQDYSSTESTEMTNANSENGLVNPDN